MTTEKGYNGWSNYETWAVKLWIDNEEGSYNYWREQAQEAWERAEEDRRYPSQTRLESASCILSELLNDEHQENTPSTTGVYADLLNAALSEVDWYEIATAMLSDGDFTDGDEQLPEKPAEDGSIAL